MLKIIRKLLCKIGLHSYKWSRVVNIASDCHEWNRYGECRYCWKTIIQSPIVKYR
jgi:hypothetical protein